MRKRLLLVGIAVTVALLSVPAWLSHFSRRPTINRETFDRIEVGMTPKEVEAVLGAPPGDYTTGPVEPDDWDIGGTLHPEFFSSWWGNDGVIEVEWDDWAYGRVCGKRFVNVKKIEQNPVENQLWRMRQSWRRTFGD